MEHLDIKVTGKVQGVFFRKNTSTVAEKLGIKGWVRNHSDGSVIIEAEGGKEVLEQFLQWCHTGPESAVVAGVESQVSDIKEYADFRIL